MPDSLADLQQAITRHSRIVQAKLDGYDISVCPEDGDLYLSFPADAAVPKGLRTDDLLEHPAQAGEACKTAEPYKPLQAVWENSAILAKVLETLEAAKS